MIGNKATGAGFTFVFALSSLLFVPQGALAQAVCVPVPDSGVGTNDVSFDGNDYPAGIQCDTNGDLTATTTVDLEIGGNGIELRDPDAVAGTDSITFTTGTEIENNGATGALLDVETFDGNIDITTEEVDADGQNPAGVTHGIRAISNGSGNIGIATTANVDAQGSSNPADSIGIEALTNSGAITMTTGGNVAGNQYGIRAESTGAGNITLNAASASISTGGTGIQVITNGGDIGVTTTGGVGNAGSGSTGIFAQTGGTGTILLDVQGPIRAGGSGVGAHAIADTGDITVNLGPDAIGLGAFRGSTAVQTQSNGLATINLSATIKVLSSGSDVCSGQGCNTFNSGADTAVRSSGNGNVVVNVIGPTDLSPILGEVNSRLDDGVRIEAPFDFSGLNGGAEVNFHTGTVWELGGPNTPMATASSLFSPGDDVVSIDAGAMLLTSPIGGFGPKPADRERFIVDFGEGDNVFNNAGTIVVGSRQVIGQGLPDNSGEMRLENLATFSNAGTIWLGASVATTRSGRPFLLEGDDLERGDLWPDDILSLPGAHFEGLVDGDGKALGRIIADIDLARVGQVGCGADFRVGDSEDLPVADCIDLRGGSAGGRTNILLLELIPGDRGAYVPEGSVLVDVSGGDPEAIDPEAFTIDPATRSYNPALGGIMDKGLFFYTIAYDPADQQYKLFGLPGSASQQFPLLRQAANSLWRASTNAWFDRQVDQRDVERDAGWGRGVWMRYSGGSVERDLITSLDGGGETFEFDNSYTQDEDTITIGWDLISRDASDGAWLVGGMLGHTRSNLSFDDSRNTAELRGMHAGVYGSLTQGGFYLDAAVNLTWLDVHNDVPAMQLEPETAILRTEARSTGGRLEAGYRLMLGSVGIEPLAGLSWVKTKVDDIDVPADDPTRFGGLVKFKSSTANNASAGLRLSMEDLLPNVAPTGISLTVRGIDEINGRAEASIENLGPIPAVSSDDLEGSYTQVTGSVNVTNPSKTLAGYVNFDVVTGDDYDSNSVSAGLRYQW